MAKVVCTNPVEVISFKIFGVFDAFRTNPKLNHLGDSVQIVLYATRWLRSSFLVEQVAQGFGVNKVCLGRALLSRICKTICKTIRKIVCKTIYNVICKTSIIFLSPIGKSMVES